MRKTNNVLIKDVNEGDFILFKKRPFRPQFKLRGSTLPDIGQVWRVLQFFSPPWNKRNVSLIIEREGIAITMSWKEIKKTIYIKNNKWVY